MKLTFKQVFILLSVQVILILLIDYFLTNELKLEGGIITLMILFFIFNIIRLSVQNLNTTFINYIMNLGSISFVFINFYFFALTLWGIGFLGGSTPLMIAIALSLNTVYFITLLIWFGKQLKKLVK